MSESTNVDNRENFDKPAMVLGLGFINGKELENSIEMHQGADLEINAKSLQDNTIVTKEGLEYYIERWKNAIKYWKKELETVSEKDREELENKIEKYQNHISIAQGKLDKLYYKDNER